MAADGSHARPTSRPASNDARLAQLIACALDLEAILDQKSGYLTSRPHLIGRQVAAGALARCRATVEGIRLLVGPRPDICGLLLRHLVEAFVVGVNSLYDPDALQGLAAENHRKVKILNQRADLAMDDVLANFQGFEGSYTIEQGVRRAGELLRSHGDGGDLDSTYDILYRGESTLGAHGLGAAFPYLVAGDPIIVRARPGPTSGGDPGLLLGLACVYTCVLARHVLRVFGVGGSEIERLGAQLELLMPSANESTDA